MNGLRRCGTYVQWNISHKRQTNAICRNMDGSRVSILSEVSQKEKRQLQYDITYLWNLKYGTDGLI